MIKIITFTNNSNKLLDFNFDNPEIEYREETNWLNVSATKHKLTFYGNSVLGYDISLNPVIVDTSNFSMAKDWIQYFYKTDKKILLISSLTDEPLIIFYGTAIRISNIKNGYAEFTVDDKKIFINNLHWFILTHNA